MGKYKSDIERIPGFGRRSATEGEILYGEEFLNDAVNFNPSFSFHFLRCRRGEKY